MPRKIGSLGRELKAVSRSLRVLDRSLARLAESIRTVPDHQQHGAGTISRHPKKMSASRLRALRTHGRYMGFLRHLRPRQKAEVKALREKKGVTAAISRARKLARK